jgi:hypothetical protein
MMSPATHRGPDHVNVIIEDGEEVNMFRQRTLTKRDRPVLSIRGTELPPIDAYSEEMFEDPRWPVKDFLGRKCWLKQGVEGKWR